MFETTFVAALHSELHWLDVPDVVCTAKPDRPLHASVQRLSMASFTIRYSAFLVVPRCLLSTLSTGFLCGWPVALELSTRQLERSGS